MTLDDWKALWATPGGQIKDEYGRTVSPSDMLRTILSRSGTATQADVDEYNRSFRDRVVAVSRTVPPGRG